MKNFALRLLTLSAALQVAFHVVPNPIVGSSIPLKNQRLNWLSASKDITSSLSAIRNALALTCRIAGAVHHHESFEINLNWLHFLAEKLRQDYHYLSSLFSTVTGITLEQHIIKQKIEKVKEYLFYDELSVKEIAYKMGYSSVAHLSSQFKKVTGLTPTEFKENRENSAGKPLDNIV